MNLILLAVGGYLAYQWWQKKQIATTSGIAATQRQLDAQANTPGGVAGLNIFGLPMGQSPNA